METTAALFVKSARTYLGTEYRTKIRHAVLALPDEAIWWRANEHSNSVGNLLLHLTGNLRQWILSGVGGRTTNRDRAAEFAATDGASAASLLSDLEAVLDEVDEVLRSLTEARLVERCSIQGRDVTVLWAVFHVVEHFSTHLGQIILISKWRAPGAVRFYEDAGGLATPVWKQLIVPRPDRSSD